ncbi:MAG: hypothetical protein ACMZ63_07960 [Methylotenera sp.]
MYEIMHSTLNKWLIELEEETVIVTSTNINEEAHGNMVTFGFNQNLLTEWGKESVSNFIKGCADLYSKKSNDLAMVFYSWFDEQASQIRISAVSQSHGKLPFKCKLNRVKLNEVVNGIYAGDSGLFTKGELDVWQQNI